jgi:hypothetical protein
LGRRRPRSADQSPRTLASRSAPASSSTRATASSPSALAESSRVDASVNRRPCATASSPTGHQAGSPRPGPARSPRGPGPHRRAAPRWRSCIPRSPGSRRACGPQPPSRHGCWPRRKPPPSPRDLPYAPRPRLSAGPGGASAPPSAINHPPHRARGRPGRAFATASGKAPGSRAGSADVPAAAQVRPPPSVARPVPCMTVWLFV